MPRIDLIQLRRDTSANWTSQNPTLASGESGFETDTLKLKIGDGSTAWNSLAYVSGGSSTLVSDTGTTITFTENTLWNEATPLTSGALTLDLTDAVKDTYAAVYCDRYVPSISGETFIGSRNDSATTLNLLLFWYDGTNIYLKTTAFPYLTAPTLSLTAGNEEIDVSWGAITNATSYLVQRDTDSGFGSPTTAYNSTGTSFTDSGLTNGTTYYYRAYAIGNGYLTSAWSVTANSTPAVEPLFEDDFTGASLDTAKWSKSDSISAFSQNNEAIWTEPSAATGGNSFINSNGKYNRDLTGVTTVIRVDVTSTANATPPRWYFALLRTASPTAGVWMGLDVNTSNNIRCGHGTVYGGGSFTTTSVDMNGSFKIVCSGGAVNFYKWNGSSWGSSLHTGTYSDQDHYLQFRLDEAGSSYTLNNTHTADNLTVWDVDFSGLTP